MKQYSHDYTLVANATEDLYRVTRLLANDCVDAALSLVNDARGKLLLYISRDNMVEDDDVADGWVKAHEVKELINGKEDEDPWDKDWHQMEQEVVKLFKEGRPFSEIAAKTGAATQTIKDIIKKYAEG